jgi:four helix bundle protein
LEIYRRAFDAAMEIFEFSKAFPKEERYSLTDQIRRSSRSVATNLAEAWRKRRYEGSFISKLSDSETEAAETQSWLEFAVHCECIDAANARRLYRKYDRIIATIVTMIAKPSVWTFPSGRKR